MILPELLTRVLPRHSLQDLRAARVLIHELCDIIHVTVDDDVHALVRGVFCCDILLRECFGHLDGGWEVDVGSVGLWLWGRSVA